MPRNRPTPIPLKFKPDTRGQQAERRCLRCRSFFASEHRGNRLCRTCSQTITYDGVDQILEPHPVHYPTRRMR